MRSTSPASSEAVTPSAWARANASFRSSVENACGVCASATRSRGIVPVINATSSGRLARFTSLTVSIAGMPRIAAFHYAHRLLELFLGNPFFQTPHSVRSRSHDDIRDLRARRDAPQAEDHERCSLQLKKLLGSFGAHARSHAGGGKNGSDSAHAWSGSGLDRVDGRIRKLQSVPQAGVRREIGRAAGSALVLRALHSKPKANGFEGILA